MTISGSYQAARFQASGLRSGVTMAARQTTASAGTAQAPALQFGIFGWFRGKKKNTQAPRQAGFNAAHPSRRNAAAPTTTTTSNSDSSFPWWLYLNSDSGSKASTGGDTYHGSGKAGTCGTGNDSGGNTGGGDSGASVGGDSGGSCGGDGGGGGGGE